MSTATPISIGVAYTLAISTQGWPIDVFQFGSGPTRLALIGGIHGGYEWNTILLAYQTVDYFFAHPEEVPVATTLYIIPAANPDGLALLIGRTGRFTPDEIKTDPEPGRFNANQVDLNRNWGCNWAPQSVWRDRQVNAGSSPFSEAETQILANFLTNPPMQGVIFWHSAMPGVFAGGCDQRFPPADELGMIYATAAGYPFLQSFDAYAVTGDAIDWLAMQGIPAISVELNNHSETDQEQNLRGILAVLDHYASRN